jgi:D-alanyl-D-alanine dipeptidase
MTVHATRNYFRFGSGLVGLGLVYSFALAGCAQTSQIVETASKVTPTSSAPISEQCPALPEGFSYLDTVAPAVLVELRYAGSDNFTGEVVDGYETEAVAVLRNDAAMALAGVQANLADEGLSLLVFDAYRPTRAVDFFMAWAQTDDDSTKAEYYPAFDKPELFSLGYIAERSNHSLGGTVDLTLVDVASGEVLDMGGAFDLFDVRSNYETVGLAPMHIENRTRLRDAMIEAGFLPYPQEWWHFSFPLPDNAAPENFVIGPCA